MVQNNSFSNNLPRPSLISAPPENSLATEHFVNEPLVTSSQPPNPSPPPKNRFDPLQWFYDLSIRNKQLIVLFTSEFITVGGLVGVGALLMYTGGRAQLVQQAKSELAVSEVSYSIKINQIGFGFRGQSDNTAVINAARSYNTSAENIDPNLQNQARQILQNEISARNIEYATLVGRDGRIIASANADRRGEVFDPNGLVTEVLQDPRQIKANAVITWEELQQEAPPLPEGLEAGNALIRYVVTPVIDPQSQEIIGALVGGDIVDGKTPIPQAALTAFAGGYSAVYFRNGEGEYELATSLYNAPSTPLDQPNPNLMLPGDDLLTSATTANGEKVAQRLKIDNINYTVTAQALPNIYKQDIPITTDSPVAVLVRGTSETDLNALLQGNVLLQIAIALLAIAMNIYLAFLLGRTIATPVKRLRGTTQDFAEGNRNARADVFSNDEVGQLAQTFNQLADNIVTSETALAEEAQRSQAARAEAEELAQNQKRQSEELQMELLTLLTNVEGASSGDLTVRAEISAGQIGIVADFFNSIIESLRDIVTQVKQAANQVNASVDASDASIQGLADEAIRQATQVSQTLNAVEQMAVSIQDVAENARQAAEVARQASATAEDGGIAMDRTVESIVQLRQTVGDTAKKVKRLGESSQQITKVISLINQIALQTNLLAINASIEAARAGEEGRGFAVVAEEVGQLAAQSAAATKEIEKIVENIQQETSEVVEAMELGTTQVVTGTRLVEDAKQSLGKIITVSRQIDGLLQSISSATVSQAETSQTVTSLMKEINQVAENTSGSSRAVSSSLQETVAITQKLQASMQTFKVEENS